MRLFKISIFIFAFYFPSISFCQIVLNSSVVSSGGSACMSATFELNGSVGQTIIGKVEQQSNNCLQGFWYGRNGFVTSTWDDILGDAISVFPNPVVDYCHVKPNGCRISDTGFVLSDMKGTILSNTLDIRRVGTNDLLILNMSALSQGIYYLIIFTDKGRIVRKIVKI